MKSYWKVVMKYGHVGYGREISVARFLETNNGETAVDIMDVARKMPAVKHNGLLFVQEVDHSSYQAGKLSEKDNFYLQQLFSHNAATTANTKAA